MVGGGGKALTGPLVLGIKNRISRILLVNCDFVSGKLRLKKRPKCE